jgi:hypothetical protein
MPTTVGSHPVPTISAPVNGTLIDANTVRGNDQTIRTAYNTHDADPGVHLQSSTFAARPAAGVAGRKWITLRDGRYEVWFDDGSAWRPVALTETLVIAQASGSIAKGDTVRITGYDTGANVPIMQTISAAAQVVFGVAVEAITSGQTGAIMTAGVLQGVNTAGTAIGNTLYSNGAGGWTPTKPGTGETQVVGVTMRVGAADGVLLVQLGERGYVDTDAIQPNVIVRRDGSGNILGSISGAAAAGLLSGTTIAAGVVNSSLTSFGDLTEMEWNGVTYQLPPADGTVGQVLGTDGAGNLDWQAPSAADAGTLTGTTLAANVVDSSLQTFGDIAQMEFNGVTYDMPLADGTAGQALTTDGAGVLAWGEANSLRSAMLLRNAAFTFPKDTDTDIPWDSTAYDPSSLVTLAGGGTTITLPAGVYHVSANMNVGAVLSSGGQEIVAALWVRRADGVNVLSGNGQRARMVSSDVWVPLTIQGVIAPSVATTYSVRLYTTYIPAVDTTLDNPTRIYSGAPNSRAAITFVKIA